MKLLIFSPSSKKTSVSSGAVALLLASLTWLVAAGCAPRSERLDTPTLRFAGQTLRVVAPADVSLTAILDRHGSRWSQLSGARLQRVEPGMACDLIIFRPWELGRLVPDLAPIDIVALRSAETYEYSLLLRYQLDHAIDWGGRTWALPVTGESLVLVFRSDLFSDPTHKDRLPVRMQARSQRLGRPVGPTTWQELAAVAEYFAGQPGWASDDQNVVPRPSLPPLPNDDHELDREFHALAASFVRPMTISEKASSLPEQTRTRLFFNYQFDAETGEPAIDQPGFVAAVQMMQRLQAVRGSTTDERPIEAFRRGKAVLALATLADLTALQAVDSPVRGRFGVARIPGSEECYDPNSRRIKTTTEVEGNVVPYLGHGGYLGGIRADSNQAALALDFLAYLTSPRVSLEIVAEPGWGAGPTRGSHFDHRSIWHNYELDPVVTNQLIESLEATYRGSALNPAFRLRVKEEQHLIRTFAQELRRVVNERSDAIEALRRIRARWQQVVADREAFLREYRESMGLK